MSRKNKARTIAYAAVVAVKHWIDTNPLSRAAVSGLPPYRLVGRNLLQNMFKEMTGYTVRAYRLQKRMEAARDLLATGDQSVKQVALHCSYINVNNFSADFKRAFGVTPTDWLQTQMDTTVTVRHNE